MKRGCLDLSKRRYLKIAVLGLDNAIKAIEGKDFKQAYIELTHIHVIPYILYRDSYDEEYYNKAFYKRYLEVAPKGNSEAIKEVYENYLDEYKDYELSEALVLYLVSVADILKRARVLIESKHTHESLIEIRTTIDRCIIPNNFSNNFGV